MSQVLELTMPMEAVADAPMWPTMAASMYSTAVTTICCRMDGMLKVSTTCMVCRSGTCSPRRICAESCSREMVMGSPYPDYTLKNGAAYALPYSAENKFL